MLRICIDPRPLNTALKRERYQLPVVQDIHPELPKAKVFWTVDLKSGYWHYVLTPESSILTTFATPHGRYRWICLPFSLSASSEIFQKHLTRTLENLSGVLCIADGILVHGTGETDEEAVTVTVNHDRSLQDLLQRCKDRGIVLNQDKMKLKMSEVEAITKMPKPQDMKGVQRLNGFVNYLAKFLPKLSEVMDPICCLTRKSNTPDESHLEVVAVPEQCRRSERVRKSPTYLKEYVCD